MSVSQSVCQSVSHHLSLKQTGRQRVRPAVLSSRAPISPSPFLLTSHSFVSGPGLGSGPGAEGLPELLSVGGGERFVLAARSKGTANHFYTLAELTDG